MKGIIFDLDGTLFDTVGDIADSMNEVLNKYGLPVHTVAAYKIFVGEGVTNLVKRAVSDIEDEDISLSQIETEYKTDYLKRQVDKTNPYDGMSELLLNLTERGIKKAVFSNKPHDATLEVMACYFPDTVFNAIIGQRPGYPIKPDPSGALEILESKDLPCDEVLYIGDTGTETAKAAGLKDIGVIWGLREKAELVENGAEIIIEHPLEIVKFL
jgi:phosphoglycolate phosphatase